MDSNQTGYIDLKCFVRGFFKVYYSSVEDKMKLAFEIYDFDCDGYIDKEDVRLVMSHIPVDSAVKKEMEGEGRFTQENGGNMAFLDRIQTQQEIQLLLDEVYGSKKRLSFDEFKRVNMEDTSEMFLSIMLMLQTHLPCSENFFRYKQNYTKYVSGDGTEGEKKEQPEGTVTEIASPKMLSRMAPIQNMARQQNINFNPVAMTHMLQGAT
jgi:Ca2+-binding EF-hand superfamily protein